MSTKSFLLSQRKSTFAAIFLLSAGVSAQEISWDYTYSDSGQKISQNGPRVDVDDTTTFTYYSEGNLKSVTNAIGHVITYNEYNSEGLPLSITDENGVTREMVYNWNGNIVESIVKHPSGDASQDHITTYDYDAVGNLIEVAQPGTPALQYDYDSQGRLTSISDSLGNRIAYTLDGAGNRIKESIKDNRGNIVYRVETAFDDLNHVMGIIGNHGQNIHIDRDGNGNETKSTDGRDNSVRKAYDALNRVSEVIDPAEGETLYTYNSYDQVTSITDPKGLVTSYEYDAFGNLTLINSPDTGTVIYTYDEAGNRTSSVDSRGVETNYTYDSINRLTEVIFPDDQDSNIRYVYDEVDAPFSTGMLTSISNGNSKIRYHYDHKGNVTKKLSNVDDVTLSTKYEYDSAGLISKVIYPSGRAVSYSHDKQGRVSEVNTKKSSDSDYHIVATDISYLPFGPITLMTYGNDLQGVITYDLDYRISTMSVSSSNPLKDIIYEYDASDNVIAVLNNADQSQNVNYSYDNLDRLSDALSLDHLMSYEYDATGNRLLLSIDGEEELYVYSGDSHRLEQRGEHYYQYDVAGNTLSNGTYDFEYSTNGEFVAVFKGEQTIAEYSYNALGQRATKTANTDAERTDYEALAGEQNALESKYRSRAANKDSVLQSKISEGHAIYDEIKEIQNDIQRKEFDMQRIERSIVDLEDQKGEVTRKITDANKSAENLRDLIVPNPTFLERILNNVYQEAADQYEAISDEYRRAAHRLEREMSTFISKVDDYTHNLLALSDTTSYLREAANRIELETDRIKKDMDDLLVLAEQAYLKAQEYKNRQPAAPSEKKTIIYVYNESGQLIGEYNRNGDPIKEYIWLGRKPLALTSNGEVYYFHNDHLSTPQLLTDSEQDIVWKADYSPFGEANVLVEHISNNLRFPGQYFDKETGLHYNYYRYYDPSTGRYLQSDPIGLSGGTSTYGYALQNPLRYTDPFGLVSWNCRSLSSGGGVLVIGGGIIRYRCESECVDGSKTIAEIQVNYGGVNLGLQFGMVGSDDTVINDNNTHPNTDVFNGEYVEVSGNYTFGIGYGVSAVSFNRGEARGVNHGITGGVGAGVGEVAGTSRVLSEVTVECDDDCQR